MHKKELYNTALFVSIYKSPNLYMIAQRKICSNTILHSKYNKNLNVKESFSLMISNYI